MADNRRRWFRPRELEPMPLGMTCKPWYEDRLPSRCFAKHKKELVKFPSSLDGRRWVFVKQGLDDFRRGCPPCEGLIARGREEAFLPTISHTARHPPPRKSQGKLPKAPGLFSRLSAAQRARWAFVEDTEARLTRRPLAVCPTLEEHVPADLLAKALQVLDPDGTLEDTCGKATKEPPKFAKGRRIQLDLEPPKIPGRYRGTLLPKDKRKKKDLLRSVTFRKIPAGLYDFCDWVDTFGDSGIDVEYMMKQFEIVYECKQSFEDTCIKKINLLPLELRHCRRLSKVKEMRFSVQETDFERKMRKPYDPYKPDREKFRYGAWYLKPKLWKKLINDEPLIDPEILLKAELEARRPDIIEELYGTIAFKDFIMSRGYSMPSILERLFTRKGWDYHTVVTPIPRVLKAHAAVLEADDEEYD